MVLTSLDLVASNAPITTRIKLVNGDEETPMEFYSVLKGQKGQILGWTCHIFPHQVGFDLENDWQPRVIRFRSRGQTRNSGRALWEGHNLSNRRCSRLCGNRDICIHCQKYNTASTRLVPSPLSSSLKIYSPPASPCISMLPAGHLHAAHPPRKGVRVPERKVKSAAELSSHMSPCFPTYQYM